MPALRSSHQAGGNQKSSLDRIVDWLYVGSWVVWLWITLESMSKQNAIMSIAVVISNFWLLLVQVIYALVLQQYAFLVMPVVLVAFSLAFRKVVENVIEQS